MMRQITRDVGLPDRGSGRGSRTSGDKSRISVEGATRARILHYITGLENTSDRRSVLAFRYDTAHDVARERHKLVGT